jgi:hypothetical protein
MSNQDVVYQPAEIDTIKHITTNINEFKGDQLQTYNSIIAKYPLPNQCTKINDQIRLHTWYLLDIVITDLINIINFATREFTTIYDNTRSSATTTDRIINIGNDKHLNCNQLDISKINTNIYILPLDFKKELTRADYNLLLTPDPEKTVNPGLINSGLCTVGDIYNRNIFIYRSCEMGFVLLHELIHNYNIEYLFIDNTDYDKINTYLTNTFKIDDPISTEAGTDAIAHVLWLKYLYEYTYKLNTKVFKSNKVLGEINKLTKTRAINMIKLFIDISINKYLTPNNTNKDIVIKEKTGAFEYFVIKYCILLYIEYGNRYIFDNEPLPLNVQVDDLLPKLKNELSRLIAEAVAPNQPKVSLPISLNRSLI